MKRFFSKNRRFWSFLATILLINMSAGYLFASYKTNKLLEVLKAEKATSGCMESVCGCYDPYCCAPDIDQLRECICNIKSKLILIEGFIREIKYDASIKVVANLDHPVIYYLHTIEAKMDSKIDIVNETLWTIEAKIDALSQ